MEKRIDSHLSFLSVRSALLAAAVSAGLLIASCAPMDVADPRSIKIEPPTPAESRRKAMNENPDSVMVVPLGKDILVPAMDEGDPLPTREVGPFELRNENLAGALQLIMADYDIPLAFESERGMTVGVTVSNLKGPLDKVVDKVCSLADMYCLYDDGVITVKENQTFTVSLPPLPAETSYDSIVTGLRAFTGAEATIDTTTRTMIYTATERTAKKAEQYFERLRKSTAMIVYETYIWEVSLSGSNSAGIRWEQLGSLGAFNLGFSIDQSETLTDLGTPISIGLPTRGAVSFTTGDILNFISTQGAVKTISQPQLTVLSGSEAELRVAETQAYVESLTRTQNTTNDTETVSTTTGQVDTGFTLTIGSSWDNGTVYGNVEINLQQLIEFQDFDAGNDSSLRLPRTAERELRTQVRVRPGDSVLIAGLVRDRQEYDRSGMGLNKPIIPFSRTGVSENSELVILLRPRVIVYKPIEEIENDAREKARLSLVHADVPDIATLSNPAGVPTEMLKKETIVPKTYEEVEQEEAAAAEAAEKEEPATTPAAKPVVRTQQPATDLPMGTLPSNLLDPSLGSVP